MDRKQPAFSIVIPTHNRCALTKRAIESVLASRHVEDIEIIVVDDASTDATHETLRDVYAHDARVRIVRLESGEGPSGARNHGLPLARGSFILFLDSDDTLQEDALAFAQEAFRHVPDLQFLSLEGVATSIDTLHSIPRIVHGENPGWSAEGFDPGKLQRHMIAPPDDIDGPPRTLEVGDLFPAVLFGDLFYLSGLVIRASAAHAAGPFDPRYRNLEDWDFSARLCQTGMGGYLDHVGFHREIGREDQLSNAGNHMLSAMMHERILANIRACVRIRRTGSARLIRRAQAAADYWLGRCLLEKRHHRVARAFLLRSLRRGYKPLKTLTWLTLGIGGRTFSRYMPSRSH